MRRLLVPTALALCALALAGCTSSAGSSSSSGGSSAVAPAGPSKVDTAEGAASTAQNADSRQVITTGSVTITVDRPAAAADEAVTIVENAGGRVDGRTEKAPVDGDRGSAQLTVRIPSAKLTTTLDALKKVGTVEDLSISKQDVTAHAKDLAARITALHASVDRLVDLMSKAATTADLITIESALSDRQANLESLESEKRSIDDQVDLSTITLTLGSTATAPAHLPDTFLSGLLTGWNSFVAFFSGLIVVLGVLLPWLALLGVIAIVLLLVLRRNRRKSAELTAAGPTAAP
ncbi:DUF4349 domain-containing protein [Glaciihabitans sp. UYNi722]|uniref:DUF4349 domain-containing protein n=1 Tax=Glaciihabitans sp. UYNi722 TaxID=3156344 RepID=UPI0033958E86